MVADASWAPELALVELQPKGVQPTNRRAVIVTRDRMFELLSIFENFFTLPYTRSWDNGGAPFGDADTRSRERAGAGRCELELLFGALRLAEISAS